MNIVEQLTATSRQLHEAGLEKGMADAIAGAIAVSQEENNRQFAELNNRMNALDYRMNAVEEDLKEIKEILKELAKGVAETNQKLTDFQMATERSFSETNQKIADVQAESERRVSDVGWAMFWKMAALQVALWVGLSGYLTRLL